MAGVWCGRDSVGPAAVAEALQGPSWWVWLMTGVGRDEQGNALEIVGQAAAKLDVGYASGCEKGGEG